MSVRKRVCSFKIDKINCVVSRNVFEFSLFCSSIIASVVSVVSCIIAFVVMFFDQSNKASFSDVS